MNFPKLSQIEAELSAQSPEHTEYSCAVLRNITVEAMEPYLRYAGMGDGMKMKLSWGDFDNVLQEAAGSASGVVTKATQAVIVCLWLPAFSEILGFSFASASAQKIEEELARVRDYCRMTLVSLRQRTSAPILWIGFEPPSWPSYGILDTTSTDQRWVVAKLNEYLKGELTAAGKAWLVDAGRCLERVGAQNFYDWRYWHMARAPYSLNAMREMSCEIQKHIRAAVGKVRKCLVLDCDNTLWGGIVGEDGVDGIHIGTEHPGSAYRDLQIEILNLYNRGVILGLCSKNNHEDVIEVFRSRSDMVLREEHFAIMRINWQDKATNLREIAEELNIGLDSIVFVDDLEFEVNLVHTQLPEVTTLQIPPDRLYESRLLLAQKGLFDSHALTDEDRVRGKMYRAEVARKVLQSSSTDLSEYLKSLEMRVTVSAVGERDLDRAAQLCQRTNQFNLTTKRYSRDELLALSHSSSNSLLSLKLEDRYGEYGVVGFCVASNEGTEATLDTFVISCRALGRGVETAFLAACADAVGQKGASTIKGSYVPTKKNAQVAEFYDRHGFEAVSKSGDRHDYKLKWQPGCIAVPDFIGGMRGSDNNT